jgi:hypothetical protein
MEPSCLFRLLHVGDDSECVVLQGAILSGIGTLKLGRSRRKTSLTVLSVIALSLVVILLIGSTLLLLQNAANSAHDVGAFGLMRSIPDAPPYQGEPTFSALTALEIILVIWILWLALGLLYLRGDKPLSTIHHLIKILLVTSWIEFGLALPLYLASRDKDKDCPCAMSSYYMMLTIVTATAILFGPGLYLFYMKEYEQSQLTPTHPQEVLRRKSKIAEFPEVKNDSYISNTRTISLIAIALGFLGFELGIFNEQRSILFSETRKTVLINFLKGQYQDDETLKKFVQSPAAGLIQNSPFGRIKLTLVKQPDEFAAEITGPYESWHLNRFQLSDGMPLERLEQIYDDLDINEDLKGSELITNLRRKFFNREVKIPGANLLSFNTGSAGWIINVLAICLLIAVRGVLRQIPHGSDGGVAEPWLVLDAHAVHEQAVAVVWRLSAAWSGWLATFGLIISIESAYIVSEEGANIAEVVATYLVFIVFLAVNTVTALQILAEIRRVRMIRRLFERATWFEQPPVD